VIAAARVTWCFSASLELPRRSQSMGSAGRACPPAALIYQHSSRVADEAIAAALDARLTERKSRPAPKVVGPAEGPTEPQLIAVEPGRSRKRASDQG
jgi:hypothetical protein